MGMWILYLGRSIGRVQRWGRIGFWTIRGRASKETKCEQATSLEIQEGKIVMETVDSQILLRVTKMKVSVSWVY